MIFLYINKKHKEIVENRGYKYICSYKNNEFTIDGKQSKHNSNIYIRVKCPYCNSEYDIFLNGFKKGNKCKYCCNKYENSFAYYIQQELNEPLNKYWDWGKNTVNPYCIPKQYNGKVWIKCAKTNYHESYEVSCYNFTKGNRCPYCANHKVHPKDSFAQWGIDNIDKSFLEKYWSDKNTLNPRELAPHSTKKIWIKCGEMDYHEDYKTTCNDFYKGSRCPYCYGIKVHPKDSFSQYHIDHTDKDFLEKYRSDKNTLNPWEISPHSHKKVWIKCQNKDYHEDYLVSCHNFYKGSRCPYCINHKIHIKDSFGALYPEKAKYRSKRNKESPYEVAPNSGKKYRFYCENCGEEFKTKLNHLRNGRSMKCCDCTSSKGEQRINDWLKDNNIKFETQKEFRGLIGMKNGNLSYDFYLPRHNLLIEYQGIQHKKFTKGFHESLGDLNRQREHDRRKRNYAKEHNIDLLEIWYWDFDNIEKILQDKIFK